MTDMISCRNVNFRYGPRHAVKDLNLTIPAGVIFGLLGPNGSGKTTTMNMITTILQPASGHIEIDGNDVVKEAEKVRRLIGLAPEEPLVYSGLTAREFILLSADLHDLDQEQAEQETQNLLVRLKIDQDADKTLASFSKGMRRKALLASALIHNPKLIVLDEPLDGLDVYSQDILKDILREKTEQGHTVLYSSHIMETVEGFCDQVGLLFKGNLLEAGPIEQVKQTLGVEKVREAFTALVGES